MLIWEVLPYLLSTGRYCYRKGLWRGISSSEQLIGHGVHNNDSRKLAVYQGEKQVLVVRVSDVNGLVNSDSADIMSDKVFRMHGDTATIVSSQPVP
jgi:hypothetical protein